MKTFDAQQIARDAALAEAEFATQVGDFVSVEYDDDALFGGLSTVYKLSQDNRKYYQWLDKVIRSN